MDARRWWAAAGWCPTARDGPSAFEREAAGSRRTMSFDLGHRRAGFALPVSAPPGLVQRDPLPAPRRLNT